MAAFPFASAYQPVQRLADMQMQINAAEQARQIEMQRMAQYERQAQLGAALQARQLQDTQAAREMQAALSFRQQAAVESQNRAVMEDAAATRTAQLGWNEKELVARERMQGDQLRAAKEIALIPRYDSKLEGVRLDRDIEEDAKRTKAIGAAAAANAKLDEAVLDDVWTEKKSLLKWDSTAKKEAFDHIADETKRADVAKRRNKLKTKIQSQLPADVLGVLKWNETTFQWEPAFGTEGKSSIAPSAQTARPSGLSSVGPFDDFRVSLDQPSVPDAPAETGHVIVAPRMQTPPVTTTPFAGFSGQSAMPQNPAFEVFPGASRIPATPGWAPFSGQRIAPSQDTDRVYTPTTDAEFEAVPEGARFVNPATGKIRIKSKKSSAK